MHKLSLSELRFGDLLRSKETVAWPQGTGEPLALTEALVAQRAELESPELLFGLTASNTLRPELADHFTFRALNGAGNSRKVTALADLVPCHVSTFPELFRERRLRAEVVLIHVRPLERGRFTLGVIADFTQAMIQQARLVVALVNPALPSVEGDAALTHSDIDLLVEADDRIIDMPDPEPSPVERRVAEHIAALVPDGATIQLGVGTLPVAVASALANHRDLGVHSGVVSDALVDLVEKGVVTNTSKGRDAGRTVTGGLFGTRCLRDFAETSRSIDLRSVEYTHKPAVTYALHRFYTINSAIEVDVSGQVNSEVAGNRYLGAVGGQIDFVRAGAASPGGRSIIALPSTTPDGKVSRIVGSLERRPVTTARSDVDLVVTEFGAADLRGCSLRERAQRLVSIAHPEHRESLMRRTYDDRTVGLECEEACEQ
jgi:acetyl-CoA hydrolase